MISTILLTIIWCGMWALTIYAGRMHRFDLLCLDIGVAYYIIVLRPNIRSKKSKEDVDD